MEINDTILGQIKAQFSESREVEVVEMVDRGTELNFIMTSMNGVEWKRHISEITANRTDLQKVNEIIERSALAMIRWPERAEVLKIFDRRPGIVQNFGAVISTMAGADAEVREKK